MLSRRVDRRAMNAASAKAEGPSYSEAFAASRPVSSVMQVWNSKMCCRVPWLTSGWYGV